VAISFIGAAAANGTSVTIPTHQAGDLLVLFAYRETSAIMPTYQNGWYALANPPLANPGSSRGSIHYKHAASSSEVSGTWTSATQMVVAVYRSPNVMALGRNQANAGTAGSGDVITYGAITSPSTPDGDKWIVSFAAHRANDTDINTAPSGLTHRASIAGVSAGEAVIFDTNGAVSGWSSTTYTLTSGTSNNWYVLAIELLESGFVIPSGGSSRPVNPFTQQVIG
jgi:hypothetical protein